MSFCLVPGALIGEGQTGMESRGRKELGPCVNVLAHSLARSAPLTLREWFNKERLRGLSQFLVSFQSRIAFSLPRKADEPDFPR